MNAMRFALGGIAAAMICGGAAGPAHALKGADVLACVYLKVKPKAPILFKFTPKEDNCMLSHGDAADLTADDVGLTCQSIGYVESKNSDGCFFETSRWALGYEAPGTSYTGSTLSTWSVDYGIDLYNYSPGTSVNIIKAVGTATKINWEGKGPLYVIFTPGDTLTPMQNYANSRQRIEEQFTKDQKELDARNLKEMQAAIEAKKPAGDLDAIHLKYVKAVEDLQTAHAKALQALSPSR